MVRKSKAKTVVKHACVLYGINKSDAYKIFDYVNTTEDTILCNIIETINCMILCLNIDSVFPCKINEQEILIGKTNLGTPIVYYV